jgi:vacuolar-type H+-ATPase subunit F/Vma7
MGQVAVIGERVAVQGFGLAGALIRVAETPDEVADGWRTLPAEVEVVLLTPAAAQALSGELDADTAPLTAVLP